MATEEELYQQYLKETGQATDYSQEDKQTSKLPLETGINVEPEGEEALYQQYLQETGQEPMGDINAPVDAEMDLYKPQQTMSMQEYGLKLQEEGVPYEDRISMMRDYRRRLVDERGVYYLDETKDNPLSSIGSAMLSTGVGLNRIVEDTLGFDMNVEQGTKMVQGAQKGMDSGTKLAGDIVAGTILGGTRLGLAATQIGMQTLGEGGTYTDALVNSALTYGGGKVIEALGSSIADAASPYTRGTLAAARMLSQNEGLTGLKTQDILDSVSHLPREHQTMALVMGTDDLKMLNQVKAVIEDDSLLSSKLGDELITRASILKSLGQNSDDLKTASQKWSQMSEAVAEVPDDFPLAGINKSIDYISNLYGTEGGRAATIINRLKLAAEEGQTIKLADIVELRKDVNFLASKATPGTREYGHFKTIKDTLNSLVDVSTVNRPQVKQLIDETVSNYSRVKNNVDYTALLNKNTSTSGVVNYRGLMTDIREAGLSSPEVDKAVEIAKMFDTKFSLDKGLTGLKPSASRTEKQLYWGSMFRWAVDTLTPYNRLFDPARFSDKLIQADIRQSIRDSRSITEFMTKVKDSVNIPKPAKDRLDELLLQAQKETGASLQGK